jgi:phosphoglycerol transferase MdoB-like AlkP superfamily enzyme
MNRYISIFFLAAGMLYGMYGILYILTKFRLIFKHGGTHVGTDIIIIVYIVSIIAVIGALIGFRLNSESKKLKPYSWLAVILTVAVLIFWSGLNIGGLIISHGEMIEGK